MKTESIYPDKIQHLPDEEAYYALIDASISGHDGYSEREGGGWHTTPYIDIVYLGNREQALGWLQKEEKLRAEGGTHPKFKIVLMKPVTVQRTVSISI